MIIRIDGRMKPYYLQTLAMAFFPGVRFPENEDETEDSLIADVSVREEGMNVVSTVSLKCGDEVFAGTGSCPADAGEWNDTAGIAAGKAFYEAASGLTGMRPPWGILTGVRPAKVASDLMYRQGMGADDAVRFLSDTYLLTGAKAQTAVRVAECEHRIITPESVNDCSLYIGIPFCPTRCAYCSFVSYTTPRLLSMIPAYLEALKTDIGKTVALIKELGLRLSTVYIGGGTPTVLDEDQLSGLLGHIASVMTR